MPDCPVCAYDNPTSATACANCGAELGGPQVLTAPGSGPATGVFVAGGGLPPPTVPVGGGSPGGTTGVRPPPGGPPLPREESDTRPGRPRRKGADLALAPAELQVDAGGTVATTLTVHNLGEEVERFRVEVNGPAAVFATAEPPDLRMLPDKKQSAVVRFTPPRDPRVPAGSYPFQVVARSSVNPEVVPYGSGVVTVAPYWQLDGALQPEVTRGRRPGRHHLDMVNAGNSPIAVQVALHDESDELVFDPRAFGGRLEPGQRLQYPFQVSGPIPWFGRTKAFPFTADLAATGRPQPLQLRAVRRQLPRLPWWVPTVALALVAVAIALFALLPKATLPNVVGLDQAAAVQELKGAGYQPVAIFQPNKDIAAGRVFDTAPKGGSPLKKGQSASLFISQGACSPCPLLVPNVVGLPLDQATTQLQRAGLTARQLPQVNPAPQGTVVDSEPKPNAEAGADKVVTLMVSTGPAGASSAASSGGGGGGGGGGGQLVVPDVVGKTRNDAKSALEQAKLVPTFVVERTDGTPSGQVVSTDPKAGSPAKPDDAVTVTVAAPTKVDLVGAAATGTWTADGKALAFPTATGSGPPAVRVVQNADLMDGSTATVLLTQPVPVTGKVSGELSVTGGVVAGDHLVAQVGFLAGSDGSVDFLVSAGGTQLTKKTVTATGTALTRLDVDLSGAAGAGTVQITAVASPGSTGQHYAAIWKDLRVSAGGK